MTPAELATEAVMRFVLYGAICVVVVGGFLYAMKRYEDWKEKPKPQPDRVDIVDAARRQ